MMVEVQEQEGEKMINRMFGCMSGRREKRSRSAKEWPRSETYGDKELSSSHSHVTFLTHIPHTLSMLQRKDSERTMRRPVNELNDRRDRKMY